MIKNAATTKAASNTSPGLLLLFYITIGTLPSGVVSGGACLYETRTFLQAGFFGALPPLLLSD